MFTPSDSNCPVLSFDISTSTFENPTEMTLTDSANPSATAFSIAVPGQVTDETFYLTAFDGLSPSASSAFATLPVHLLICGMETIALNQFYEPASFNCPGDTILAASNKTSVPLGVIPWDECQETCLADLQCLAAGHNPTD